MSCLRRCECTATPLRARPRPPAVHSPPACASPCTRRLRARPGLSTLRGVRVPVHPPPMWHPFTRLAWRARPCLSLCLACASPFIRLARCPFPRASASRFPSAREGSQPRPGRRALRLSVSFHNGSPRPACGPPILPGRLLFCLVTPTRCVISSHSRLIYLFPHWLSNLM